MFQPPGITWITFADYTSATEVLSSCVSHPRFSHLSRCLIKYLKSHDLQFKFPSTNSSFVWLFPTNIVSFSLDSRKKLSSFERREILQRIFQFSNFSVAHVSSSHLLTNFVLPSFLVKRQFASLGHKQQIKKREQILFSC